MSREIKFRVRDKDTKKILGYEVFNSILNDGYYFIDLSELKDNETIEDLILHTNYSELPMLRPLHPLGSLIREEYTGLKDKNGVEIYEGDFVLAHPFTTIWEVKIGKYFEEPFDSKRGDKFNRYGIYAQSGIKQQNINSLFLALDTNSNICEFDDMVEVIGNIYENPELLEKTK